jgi:ribonuclease P protein component
VRTARNQYGYARILVRVGKKLIRKASVRNRARRLIKEVFRLCRAALPARDYYITVAATLDQAHLRDARKELEQFFRLER